jgi:hypothetical protein
MFNADPTLNLLTAFGNFDAGTELIKSRNMVPVPHWHMKHFLHGPLTPRQAWEMVVTQEIIMNNAKLPSSRVYKKCKCGTALPLAQPEFTVPLVDPLLT